MNYEELFSSLQDLSFDYCQSSFKKCNLEFDERKFDCLGIRKAGSDMYTNLALILSDQCPFSMKVGVFADDKNTKFVDNHEFTGSIFSQLDETLHYISLLNKTSSSIEGWYRTDKKDYPDEGIREALLNAVIHRDYSISASIMVKVNAKEMQIISIGGLLSGLTPDDVTSGISVLRNKNLAELFKRLGFIECYGTGICRIFDLYKSHGVKPKIEVTQNTFKIILPNMNYRNAENEYNFASESEVTYGLTEQMKQILSVITKDGYITDEGIEKMLGLKKTRAFTIAKQMRDRGLIKAVGRGETRKYIMP